MMLSISSCSLACFKTHKQQCQNQTNQESEKPGVRPLAILSPAKPTESKRSTQSKNSAAVESLAEFKYLLTKYPKLKSQLKSIWETTQGPSEDIHGRPDHSQYNKRFSKGSHPPKNRGPWTPEQGHEHALNLLRETCESDKGMREFVDLIALKYGTQSNIERNSEDDT